LSGNETKCVIAAVREILGWEEKRATRRSRISLSRFVKLTGSSRETVRKCLEQLESANILLPVGTLTNDGQEFEFNIGQFGDYNWMMLRERIKPTACNPDPSAARASAAAKRSQLPLDPSPQVAGEGVYPLDHSDRLDGVYPLDHINAMGSNQIDGGGLSDRPEGVYQIDTTNKETKKLLDQEISVGLTPLDLWQRIQSELALTLSHSNKVVIDRCSIADVDIGVDSCTITLSPPSPGDTFYLERLLTSIQRCAKAIAGTDNITFRVATPSPIPA